jgi:hypothetical protein
MSQSDGEPAWQGKTYNALKDKKHLTGINKEGVSIFPRSCRSKDRFETFTYESLLNHDILGYGLWVEITHPR